MRIIIFVSLLFSITAGAATIEKIDFPESLMVGQQNLVLNGVGLRAKKKMGMTFRVYVAGLYVKAKTDDSQKLINDGEIKVIDMVFLRNVDKKTITESWTEHIAQNCKVSCDTIKDSMKPFLDNLTDMKDQGKMRLVFDKKGLSMTSGASEKRIDDPALSTNVIAVFFGANPPTPELKRGLLGL